MTFKEALAILPQYILPHHFLSRIMRRISHSENNFIKTLFITQIIKYYGVNMAESIEEDINAFKSFNHFFTRTLKPGLRPVTNEANAIASPADGAISQAGAISDGTIFQAKGKSFTAIDLLGGSAERAAPFNNGVFSTIYLAPKDYHRMHMPLTGTLREMIHVPGRLFSVNTVTANNVPGLFARNERVVAIFDTAAGPMALVLVGAIFVCSIETVWHGEVTPPSATSVQTWQYDDKPITLNIGEELGRFNMGSTIIVLFADNKAQWRDGLDAGAVVKLGEKIGTVLV
jgi:phosphatidylserine decarboxylase